MLTACEQRAAHDSPVLGPGRERADDLEQPLARPRLELAPELVGAAKQADVSRLLVVGKADDPRLAVHRAAVVHEPELLEAEHPLTPPGEVKGGRGAHRADADDDRVVASAGGRHALMRSSRAVLSSIRRSTSPRSMFVFVIP